MDVRALAAKIAAKHNTRNPLQIAEDLGFIIVFAPLVDMRGYHQRIRRRNIIYINSDLDEQQQRLVCAHELGHHFMHRGMNRFFMDHSTQIVTQKFENEAHCFSMELIYSDEELSPFLSRSVSDAAAYMGVSLQMAEWRMNTVEPSIWGMYE